MQAYVELLIDELHLKQHFFSEDTVIETVYFGGGTPSLLTEEILTRIIHEVQECWPLAANAEITLEANPDDIDIRILEGWLNAGINRLSIGVQAFNDNVLKWMGRRHSMAQSLSSITLAAKAGFKNISIDLIYGLPEAISRNWQQELMMISEMDIQHVSAYILSLERGTAFYKLMTKGELILPKDENVIGEYYTMLDILSCFGIKQYEISNFSRDGFRSKHNSSYWTGEFYLGLGPSAHSYNGTVRSWNSNSLSSYQKQIEGGMLYHEAESLSCNDHLNEYLMTRLRTTDGINTNEFKKKFSEDEFNRINTIIINRYNMYFDLSDDKMRINREGFMLSDEIITTLMK